MLSASRILKNINRNRELLANVRVFSLSLNENVNDNTRYKKQWRNEVEFLETNTRRYGRIDPFIFQSCLKSIRTEDLTSKEGLLLLRCCGSLMYNKTKKKRNEYLKVVWKLLEEKRIPLNIMHYNLLMKMYLENGHEFEPQTILDEIKKNGLVANLRTYEFVVAKYCNDGKLDKVTELLESMNEQGLSLTAPIFDSLILGYFINKDIKTALETLQLMNESKINVTNTTFKNILIGYLHNSDTVNVVEEFEKLSKDYSIVFEIGDISQIIEHMANKNLSKKDAKDLKQLLVQYVRENENYYNELSNCCYNLILKGEYDLVRQFYERYFYDNQSKDYFIKRMIVSILKSDETKILNFVQFLKELHPSFNFVNYTKSTLRNDQFDINKILALLHELKPVLENQEMAIHSLFLEKCSNEEEVHALTEQYLSNLDLNWINHIKQKFLPKIQTDLIQYLETHLKLSKKEESKTLLTLSIYCKYFDQLDIDTLKEITRRFRPKVTLLSNKYLLERTSEVIDNKPDQFSALLVCLHNKLFENYIFRDEFIGLCTDKIKDNAMLKTMIGYFDKEGIMIRQEGLEERHLNKLRDLFISPVKSKINNLKWKLVNNESIQINDELIELKQNLQIATVKDLFITSLNNENIEMAKFFFHPTIHLNIGNVVKYTLLRLENDENAEEVMKYFDEKLAEASGQKIILLHPQINRIFDHIKNNKNLIYPFINRISLHTSPIHLYDHLTYFYEQTNDTSIGENLISLSVYLLKHNDRNRIFRTMIRFIESKNTSLLQLLSNKISREVKFGKSRAYQELAVAFVYTQRYKQAIKVINTNEFELTENLHQIFIYLQSINRTEVIKQYSILVYQEMPNMRKRFINFLDTSLTKLNENALFQEILSEIKQLNLAKQKYGIEYDSVEETSAEIKQETIDKPLIMRKFESKEELIELVDEIIAKKKSFKLNVECDIVDRLLNIGELEKTVDLIYDMLVNERYPIPAVIKNVFKELNKHARIDLIDKLEPHLPLPLKESEFYKSNKITTYLRTTNSEDEIVKCLKNIQVFSADLIDQILTMKPDHERLIVNLLSEKKKSNLNYIWLHFMKHAKFDKAFDLAVNNTEDLSAQNLLYQPVINLVKQNDDFELAKQLINYANKFKLKSNTIQSIYNVYLKLCLSDDRIDEAKRAIEEHYRSKPDFKLDLLNLDQHLINKLDKSFLQEYNLSNSNN